MNDFKIGIEKKLLEGQQGYFEKNIQYHVAEQYKKDSFLYREENSCLLFIGVCFNRAELLSESEDADWGCFCFSECKKDLKSFLHRIDGYFCGCFIDSQKKDVLLFSDHLSSLPVYYYNDEKYFLADTDLIRLAAELRRLGLPVRVSELGGYSMLAYSFMLDNLTPINNVYKVKASTIMSMRENCAVEYFEYYSKEKAEKVNMNDVAYEVHCLFDEAVKNTFALDGDADHLVTLSGGLDSRMCLMYAIKQGITNITTLNYSQSFYREEVIAKQIAADYHLEHIFFSLDNGNYLANIDEGIRAAQGMTTYRPILSSRMIWTKLKMEQYGLIHTGLLGDTILGGYCIGKCNKSNRFESPQDLAFQLNPKNKSLLSLACKDEIMPYFDRILDWIPLEELKRIESEKYILDNRYMNGLMQSYLGARDLAVVSSPYVDKKLMKYVFSLPSEIRLNHNLYFEWMEHYMPEAAMYRWENTGLKPMYGKIKVKPNTPFIEKFKALDAAMNRTKPERSRNPYQYWMKHNSKIMEDLKKYCSEKIYLLEDAPELFEFVQAILKYDNIYMAIRAATLLGMLAMCQGDVRE